MSSPLATLLEERGPIRSVGVVGMGYVGIPAAVLFAHAPGIERVLGFQRDSPSSGYKIGMLNRGESPLKGEEPDLEPLLAEAVRSGRFACTSDFSRVGECDAVTLAIQTPFADPKDLLPDFGPLFDGVRRVGEHLAPGTLVVLESTVTPGTTVGPARELLEEASGLRAGTDFALAHAPERVMVGRLIRNIREHDRVVGGIDAPSTARAVELYERVLTSGTIIPMSATAAEATKTAENTFRDLQIAAVNRARPLLRGDGDQRLRRPDRRRQPQGRGDHPGRPLARGRRRRPLPDEGYLPPRARGPDARTGCARLSRRADRRSTWSPAGSTTSCPRTWPGSRERVSPARVAPSRGPGSPCWDGRSSGTRTTPGTRRRNRTATCSSTPGPSCGSTTRMCSSYPGVPISRDLEEVLDGADAVVLFTAHDEYRHLDPVAARVTSGREHPVIVDGRNLVDPDPFIRAGWIYKGIGRGDRNEHPVA